LSDFKNYRLVFTVSLGKWSKSYYSLEILCRREEQKHGEPLPEEDIRQDESQDDYKLNYHGAKLTFGLVLFEFNDAVKEGDIC